MGSLVAELAEKLSSATNNFDIDEGTIYVNTSADTVGIGTTTPGSKLDVQGTMQVGVNDTGHDVKFFGATAGAYLEWDESADELELRGGAATPGKLLLSTAETTVVDGNEIGRINFQAPLDSAGTDAILVGASIHAEADATFSASVNSTDLVFSTGDSATAVERMRIDSSGLVGIGTTAPGNLLNVVGTADNAVVTALQLENTDWASSETGQGVMINFKLSQAGTAQQDAAQIIVGKDSPWHDNAARDAHIAFKTTEDATMTERVRISHDGKVGIGTTAPGHLLHVSQTAASGMGMLVYRNKNAANSDNALAEIHNDHIDDDQTALHVRQDSPGYAIHVECNTNTTNYGNGIAISTQDENTTSYPLYIGTNTTSVEAGNARFVVRADGKVGIGAASPSAYLEATSGQNVTAIINTTTNDSPNLSGNGVLNLKQTAVRVQDRGPYMGFFLSNNTGSASLEDMGTLGFFADNNSSTRTAYFAISNRNTGHAQTMRIHSDGTFVGSTSADISDKRLKENIKPIKNGLTTIEKLAGKTFTWKAKAGMQAGTQYGLIAQEVEAVNEDLVLKEGSLRKIDTNTDDMAEDQDKPTGKDGIEYAKNVKLTSTIPILIEAVKELSAKVKALEGA